MCSSSLPAARLTFGDPLRVLAILGVIGIHSAHEVSRYGTSPTLTVLAAMMTAAGRWAVPGFFMLSGALLLTDKIESRGAFYRRRFSRIAVPVLIWSALYFLLNQFAVRGGLRPGLAEVLRRATKDFISGRPEYHMWFVYALMFLYLAVPFLRTWWRHADASERRAGTLLALGLAALCHPAWAEAPDGTWSMPPGMPVSAVEWVFYAGYFLLGALLRAVRLTSRQLVGAAVVFTVAWSAQTLCRLALRAGWSVDLAELLSQGSLSPLVIAMAVSMFLLLVGLCDRFPSAAATIGPRLGLATFGVYLSHLICIRLVMATPGVRRLIAFYPTPMLLGVFLVVTAASFAFALIALRVPKARVFVGG